MAGTETEELTDEEIATANERVEALTAEQNQLTEQLSELAAEEDYAAAYASAESELDALGATLGAQKTTQRSLLEAAANKPVDDRIEAAVRSLLGL